LIFIFIFILIFYYRLELWLNIPFHSSWLPTGPFRENASGFTNTTPTNHNNVAHPPISTYSKQHNVRPYPADPLTSLRAAAVRSWTCHSRVSSHLHSLSTRRPCNGTYPSSIHTMARQPTTYLRRARHLGKCSSPGRAYSSERMDQRLPRYATLT
jgi:hypothetical protein